MNPTIERMRRDWDERARDDAKYWVAFQRRNQSDQEFDGGAPEIVARVRRDYGHLPSGEAEGRRVLEIGCGLGRLMRSLAADCSEIHGVDISPEMVAQGRARLADLPNAHFHVAEQSDLSLFADGWFDLVYSYAVFQHIPEAAAVYRYLDEAFRVLKPGGVFIAQFNAAPPAVERCDTWVGAWLPERALLDHARERGWQVLSSEGAETQYLWLTLKKPVTTVGASADSMQVTIGAVTRAGGAPELVAGGPQGFAWLKDVRIPEDCCTLTELAMEVAGRTVALSYIGPPGTDGLRLLSGPIPETTPFGPTTVALSWRGRRVSNVIEIVVGPEPPAQPRLVKVTDGENISQEGVVSCGVMQVSLEGCQDIGSLELSVEGCAVEVTSRFCVDPRAGYYLINARVPRDIAGRRTLRVAIDGVTLAEEQIEFR